MTQTAALIDWNPGDTATYQGRRVTLGYWATSSNHTARALGHNCGDVDCRRFDVTGGTAWECQLSPVTAQPTPDSDRFPTVGHRVTRRAGNATITIQRTEFAYTVTTERGGFRVDDNSGSYPTEAEAVLIAEGYRRMYRAEVETPGFAPVRYRSVPRGTSRRMSDEQAEAILTAGDGGIIRRGGHEGELNVSQLWALHDRRYVTAYAHRDRPHYPLYAVVTTSGVDRAAEILTATTTAA